MISLTANGHAWRKCVCGAIECGHDYDETQVRELFDQAAAWAKRKGYRLDLEFDHAAAYLASRDRHDTEPAIPRHVRLFCAEKNKLKLVTPDTDAARRSQECRADRSLASQRSMRKPAPQYRPSMTIRA